MFILCDIGATNTRLAKSDGQSISDPAFFGTPKNFSEAVETLKGIIRDLARKDKMEAISIGIPSPLDSDKKMINPPNLPDWKDKNIEESLAEFNVPIYVENDSALAGLGEVHHGAGKGYKIVAYMTVSSGIGGALISHGNIHSNTFGFEPGHQIINFKGEIIKLEEYIGGKSIGKRMGKRPEEIDHSDPFWEETARILAVGLNNTTVYWSPEIIILGGSLINHDAISIPRVENYLNEYLSIFKSRPIIRKSALGDSAGLLGAMTLLNQKLK